MKNKYNIAAYKECAEVKVYHKVENYSFFTEKECQHLIYQGKYGKI